MHVTKKQMVSSLSCLLYDPIAPVPYIKACYESYAKVDPKDLVMDIITNGHQAVDSLTAENYFLNMALIAAFVHRAFTKRNHYLKQVLAFCEKLLALYEHFPKTLKDEVNKSRPRLAWNTENLPRIKLLKTMVHEMSVLVPEAKGSAADFALSEASCVQRIRCCLFGVLMLRDFILRMNTKLKKGRKQFKFKVLEKRNGNSWSVIANVPLDVGNSAREARLT
ncbi:hypothetical protein Ciccas_005562 [Cichlidogyrus casuarinus]|uniref:Uncharacterized protein n=1 Tax=Cichlidogyrus casuarinus TaxID=1844966 RepID=A0ABD2Q895_9PLAT